LAAKAAKAAGVPAPAAAPPAAPKPVEAVPAEAPSAKPAEVEKPKPKPAAIPAPPPAPKVEPAPASYVTRREFLNYAWLASITLFSVQTIAISLWFAYPNFKAGEFGGEFPIGPATEALPEVNAPPKAYIDGKFWLANLDTESPDGQPRKGILAIYKVCTHLGCLYEWITMTNRFECPCHGSKFALTADYLAGPARRSLDRFVIKAIGPDGKVVAQTNEAGDPLVINGDEELIVDTGQKIEGAPVITPA
jgi:cytochrome b6-f complex iron-sulfur subunit